MSYDTVTKTFVGEAPATEVTCWCGIRFAVPRSLHAEYLRKNEVKRGSFSLYCPLGHEFVPKGPSEADRLREQLERANSRAARLSAELTHKEREIVTRKGHATRLRKRIAAGVCPCCNRTFQDLARHMAGQHPDYASTT